ncbi:hypothetical protein Cantr_10442 [Candida viswanathii]|uniref:Uncharacterized protein n=1 Tax=Candida viswanathii TaxID=5486 RepID=A0A367YGR8_9ASCO|nr:hypothetical protein Cantr_10442 [Candida viswanathii]
MTRIRIVSPTFIPAKYYERYQSLKELDVGIMVTVDFGFLPQSLEILKIEELYEIAEPPGAEVPQNLKVFKAGVRNALKTYLDLVHQMKNLGVLKICDSPLANIDDLKLPESKIKKLSLVSCQYLTKFSSLLRFPNLKRLLLDNCRFPLELFQDESGLAKLRTFKFKTKMPLVWRNNLNDLKFPQGLTRLALEGEFVLDNWQVPEKIRTLHLMCTNFVDISNFKLPPDFVYFEIERSKVKNLDGLQFPTGLLVLVLERNENLCSMSNTNLPKLTEFMDVRAYFDDSKPNATEKTRTLLTSIGRRVAFPMVVN